MFSFTLCVFIESGRFAFLIVFCDNILDLIDESVRYTIHVCVGGVVLVLGRVTYWVESHIASLRIDSIVCLWGEKSGGICGNCEKGKVKESERRMSIQ